MRLSTQLVEGTNTTVASVPIKVFRCPSVPRREDVSRAIAKPPRPALTFDNPVAPTDYEAIMGVKPASINPHLGTEMYNGANRFSVMYRNSATPIGRVLDGTSSTVMVVECAARPLVYRRRAARSELSNDQGIGWADSEGPFSLDGARGDGSAEGCGPAGGCVVAINARNDNEPYGFHPGGCHLLYADAHVRFASQSVSLSVIAAACTMNAGELHVAP